MGIRRSFFGKKLPGREIEYLTTSSAEADNEWRYTSTHLVRLSWH
jgi:hypothetical protein